MFEYILFLNISTKWNIQYLTTKGQLDLPGQDGTRRRLNTAGNVWNSTVKYTVILEGCTQHLLHNMMMCL